MEGVILGIINTLGNDRSLSIQIQFQEYQHGYR